MFVLGFGIFFAAIFLLLSFPFIPFTILLLKWLKYIEIEFTKNQKDLFYIFSFIIVPIWFSQLILTWGTILPGFFLLLAYPYDENDEKKSHRNDFVAINFGFWILIGLLIALPFVLLGIISIKIYETCSRKIVNNNMRVYFYILSPLILPFEILAIIFAVVAFILIGPFYIVIKRAK